MQTCEEKVVLCDAKDAIVSIIRNADGSVSLTMAPGWDKVLPQTMEEDPACLIMWDHDNCSATIAAFNAAIDDGALPPEWLQVGAGGAERGRHFTIDGLQAAILAHVQAMAGGGGVVGNVMIAPNTLAECIRVCTTFSYVGFEPFFRAHAVCPIGRHYLLADNNKRTTAVANPIVPPPVGLGVPVFA